MQDDHAPHHTVVTQRDRTDPAVRSQPMAATRHSNRHRSFGAIVLAALAGGLPLALAACATGGASAQSQNAELPGTVELNQTPPNDVMVGGGGTGTVDFHGKIYHFAIGGLG